jgi:hypothetical protein
MFFVKMVSKFGSLTVRNKKLRLEEPGPGSYSDPR